LKKNNDGQRTLIFCETKRGVDDLVRYLYKDRVHGVVGIHGDKTQYVRLSTVNDPYLGERRGDKELQGWQDLHLSCHRCSLQGPWYEKLKYHFFLI
jgi:hypothetical protein